MVNCIYKDSPRMCPHNQIKSNRSGSKGLPSVSVGSTQYTPQGTFCPWLYIRWLPSGVDNINNVSLSARICSNNFSVFSHNLSLRTGCARGLTGSVAELRDCAFCYDYITTFMPTIMESQFKNLQNKTISVLQGFRDASQRRIWRKDGKLGKWQISSLSSCHQRARTTSSARSIYIVAIEQTLL